MAGSDWTLKGRLFIEGRLALRTDLHIGADELDVGAGLGESFFAVPDNPIIRTRDGEPFVPGSTVKGCMRSVADVIYHGKLLEKLWRNALEVWSRRPEQNQNQNQNQNRSQNSNQNRHRNERRTVDKKFYLPECEERECWTCRVFGRRSDAPYREPTRLRVEDAFLVAPADTYARTQNAIHRLLSAANPRRSEYVPRGTEFALRIVYSMYWNEDLEKGVPLVLECLCHLEDTGIGGGRSRGTGSVAFKDLALRWRGLEDYRSGSPGREIVCAPGIAELIKEYEKAKSQIISTVIQGAA